MGRAIKDSSARGALPPLDGLKQRRLELGLTQEEFAERLRNLGMDVNRTSVSHWEHGRYPMPLNEPTSRQILAQALELSIPELLELASFEVDYSQVNEIALRAMELDPKDRQDVLEVIRWIQEAGRSDSQRPAILDQIDPD